MRSYLAVLLSLFSAVSLAAQVPVAADFPLAAPVHAELVAEQQLAAERSYPQSTIRRVSNQLRYDPRVEVEGQLTSRTYQLAPGHKSAAAFDAAHQALLQVGGESLFWCEGRECGSSSHWANAIFGNPRLYGPDDQQAYLLVRLASPAADSLVALYSITRGNRRAYLHMELLQANTPLGELLPAPATLLRELQKSGVLQLRNLPASPEPRWSQLLARSLNLDRTLRVQLAGRGAPLWQAALLEQGIQAQRLTLGDSSLPHLQLQLER